MPGAPTCILLLAGAHEKTVGKERATPTQLIKTAKARHLVGVTIFRCSMWPRPPRESFSYS